MPFMHDWQFPGVTAPEEHDPDWAKRMVGKVTIPPLTEPNKRLVHFAREGDLENVRRCVNELGADVNYDAGAALATASFNGHLELVVALVKELGADVDVNDGKALELAAWHGNYGLVIVLIERCNAQIMEKALSTARMFNYNDIHAYLTNRPENNVAPPRPDRGLRAFARRLFSGRPEI